MRSIVALLARTKPWLLFVISVAPIILATVAFHVPVEPGSSMAEFQSAFTLMMAASLPSFLIIYAWFLTVGIICNQSLDAVHRKPDRLFRFSVPFAMAYIVIGTWAFPEAVMSEGSNVLRTIILPLHVVASILLFYSVGFAARSLAMLDHPASPGFWRSFRYFLGLLYYPIGLWFIQPRVNAIATSSQDGR